MTEENGNEEGQMGLVNPFDGLQGDDLSNAIKQYPNVLSWVDSKISTGVNSGIENFKIKGMQEILNEAVSETEERIRSEINPEESEVARISREFNEYKTGVDSKERLAQLKDNISGKAKEMNFPDPLLMRDFVDPEIDKETLVIKYMELFRSQLKEQLGSEIKNKFSHVTPKMTKLPPADLESRIKEARRDGKTELALKLQMIKNKQDSSPA